MNTITTPIIRAAKLAYVRIQVSDLERSQAFFDRFGLTTHRMNDTLFARGAGTEHHLVIAQPGEPRLVAIAFEANSVSDLDRLSSEAPGASAVENIDGEGGGLRVVLADPDGNRVEVVYGIATVAATPASMDPEFNSASKPLQRRNTTVRVAASPSRVQRLGHVVRTTPSVEAQVAWYNKTLGLLASDDVLQEDGSGLVMSFVRLDRQEEFVDHHALQFLKGRAKRVHHISFEVRNLDDLYVGHEHLAHAGDEHVWGVGRHLQGSQIFDYWLDPDGVMYEHWTDSDRLNAAAEKGVIRAHNMEGPWGPPMPQAFLTQSTP